MEGRHPVDNLQVERDNQLDPNHRHHNDGTEGRGEGELTTLEDLEFQEWFVELALAPDQDGDQDRSDDDRGDDHRIGPTLVPDAGEPVEHATETKRRDDDGQPVKVWASVWNDVLDEDEAGQDDHGGDRDDHPEEPAPAEVVDDPSGQGRADRRGQPDDQAVDPHGGPPLLGWVDGQHDVLHQWHVDPHADRLDESSGEQDGKGWGQPGHDGPHLKGRHRQDE